MAYIVTENCIRCKYTDCVDVCPVDCFHEGDNFLVIDPEECIDCDVCVVECPVDAIFSMENLPKEQEKFIEINTRLAKKWPVINKQIDPLSDAEEWDGVAGKIKYLNDM